MATQTKKKRPKTVADFDVQRAAQEAAAAIAPNKQEIRDAIREAEASRVAALNATTGVTDALGRLSAGDAEAAKQAYQQAAERVAAYGTGFTGALRDTQAAPVAGAEALIRSLGGTGSVATASPAATDVTQYASGTIPASALVTEAARALVNMKDRRVAAGAGLADSALAGDYKSQMGIGDLRKKLLEVEAKRPGLIAEALKEIRQARNAERAVDVQAGYLKLQTAKSLEEVASAKSDLTGFLHEVRNGKIVNTGTPAPGSDASVEAAAEETKRANAETRAQAQRDAATIRANATKAAAQIRARNQAVNQEKTKVEAETTLRTSALKTLHQLVGYSEKAGKPLYRPPQRVTLMAALYNAHGAALVGRFGYTEQQVREIMRQIVMSIPNDWYRLPVRGKGSSGGGVTA